MDYLTLNNGVQLPMVGFGTWDVRGEAGKKAILTALELGNAISMTGETDLPMQELMSDFSIVQRTTPDKLEKDEELAAYWNAGKAFYEKVTQGAA